MPLPPRPPVNENQRRALAMLEIQRRTQRGLQPPEIPPPPRTPDIPTISTPPVLKWTERHARWASALWKIAGALLGFGGILLGILGYAWRKAAEEIVANMHIDPLCIQVQPPPGQPKPANVSDKFDAYTMRLEKLEKRLDDPADPSSKLGGQLDRIEKMLLQDHQIKSPSAPAPPAVGPTAAQQGRR